MLSAAVHAGLIFAAFNTHGTYKIFTYIDKTRDAFLAPREIIRYPLALRASPRPPVKRSGAEEIAPAVPAGTEATDAVARPTAEARKTGGKTAPEQAGPGGPGGSGPGGFKLVYPIPDAKISLSKSAASIEDTLVPPGLYRDLSKVDLSKTGGRGEGPGDSGGGGPVVGQAVPRAKRQTGRNAVVLKLPGVDFKPWAEKVLNQIQRNWALPLDAGSGWKGEVGVRVLVAKDGRVLGVELDAPTKIELLDQATLRAVNAAAPFPALPAAYPQSSLEVYFVFRYGD